MMQALDISTSALVAQRQRMNTIAGNIANINTTRDAEGNLSPFQRRLVTFSTTTAAPGEDAGGLGVQYEVKIDSETPPRRVFDPGHADADETGYVSYPGINLVTEFVNAMEASRAYEANVAAIDFTKNLGQMSSRILE
jgi:flagellar basal-body rod protein FlgC